MRTISVYLNDTAQYNLEKIMLVNECSISDAVTIALQSLAAESNRIFTPTHTLWGKIKQAVERNTGLTIAGFCEQYGIRRQTLRDLCRRVENGSEIRGFGDSNKWRDKQDGRIHKTHTAYITDCLKKHANIDLEAYNADNSQ